eukprot:s1483_g13.t1
MRPRVGLHYRIVTGEDFGPGDSLRHPRSVKHIEVYSDASLAPYKSVQCTLVSVAGCPVMWSSSRQTLVSQSTAEAELIGMQEGHQQGEGVASLVEELLQDEVNSTLYSDSKSAISLSTMDCGAWRTRHLRLRAHGLRSSLRAEGARWNAHHLPGLYLAVDALTKAVQGPQFQKLLQYLAIGPIDGEPVDQSKVVRGLRKCANSVVTKLLAAASALVAVATLGGADAPLLTSLGGALAILAQYLKGNSPAVLDALTTNAPASTTSEGVHSQQAQPSELANGHVLSRAQQDPADHPDLFESEHGDEPAADQLGDANAVVQLGLEAGDAPSESFPWRLRLCQIQKN